MKRVFYLIIFCIVSLNLYAINPSALIGKTYMGDIIPEPGSSWQSISHMGSGKIFLIFKNSSQVELAFMFVPSGEQVENLLSLLSGKKSNEFINKEILKYKISGDTLQLIYEDEPTDLMIVRDGEAIVISNGDEWGLTAVLTKYKD